MLGPILFAICIGLKPTSLIFVPLLGWFALKNKERFQRVCVGGVITIVLYICLARLTSNRNIFLFTINLYERIFARGEMWTWINSFNFWRLVTGFVVDFNHTFLMISYKIWGYIIYAGFNVYVFWRYKARDWQSALKALFILAFSGWLFTVTMHERYLFAGIVVGLIVSAGDKRLFRYWLILGIIFSINIYYGWWTPEIPWLRNVLSWGIPNDGFIPKILSFLNIFIFSRMLALIPSKRLLTRDKKVIL
jgi:hypothetical protein